MNKFTLTLATLVVLLSYTMPAQARALDTPNAAIAVKNNLSKMVLNMEGVNGIGVTGCDPETGRQDVRGRFVHCVEIMTETQEAAAALKALYPEGTKIKGIFIVILQIGKISIQPRMSVGN